MRFRGNWEISRSDLNGPLIVGMVSTEQDLMDPEYDDYSASTARGLICCRSAAVIVISLSLSLCHVWVCVCVLNRIIDLTL
ncbi:Zinc finger protein [Quillaja saponaria]|uniref:Zinc finger protein n=1 Tax=Quillaja saponaria TaxID=32244 RepID=A0AAD7PGH1_QUISA|nr:Zinc finger protein [Quillaja saponaria]